MSLGGSSLVATSALRDQRNQIYAAQAAVDEEATRLRSGSPCQGDFSAPPYSVPKANPVSVVVRPTPGPGATCVLTAVIGTQQTLQASFIIDPTAGTATVQSWDASHERYNPPDPGRGGD
jgi:hypothetical protein